MFDQPPETPDQLHAWLVRNLEITVPREPIVQGSSAPFSYLCHAFFEKNEPRDALVWANRGGGKTYLGAVATALDLAFKPGIEIRILAGSLEQAGRMHEHLRALFSREPLAALVDGRMTDKRLRLTNGSRVELLAASQASVRGTRVQKLRCDEVDLFDPKIWEAAQLVTRSATCGQVHVPGSIECLSTMHQPFGMMSKLVKETKAGARKLFRWGVVDVLTDCSDAHHCRHETLGDCALLDECAGSAKGRAEPGHISIEDAKAMKSRVALSVWNAEMLSKEPRRSDCVYPGFRTQTHVVTHDPEPAGCRFVCGMDFGFRAPTVILWAHVAPSGVVTIVRERVEKEIVLEAHARAIAEAKPLPEWVGVDPAGRQRSGQTGRSDIQVLRDQGLAVKARPSRIAEGIALVSARLSPASGEPTLFVYERCAKLIEALQQYHYPPDNPSSTEPVKDGPDHACDALRYLIVNLDATFGATHSKYAP